jgi:hypothetical protein
MFMKGLEAHIGQRVKRDRALSIGTMVELQAMAERSWEIVMGTGDKNALYKIAQWTNYFLMTFCHSLRGWKTAKGVYGLTVKQLVDEEKAAQLNIASHLGLALYGRFKSCGNSNAFLLCMIAGRTASGLEPMKWLSRLIDLMKDGRLKSDWLFQHPDGSRMAMSDFSEQFYDDLLDIQRRRSLRRPEKIYGTTPLFCSMRLFVLTLLIEL